MDDETGEAVEQFSGAWDSDTDTVRLPEDPQAGEEVVIITELQALAMQYFANTFLNALQQAEE